jgi:hypothetical protein
MRAEDHDGLSLSAKLIRSVILILSICLWTFAIADDEHPRQTLPGGYGPAEVGKDVKAAAEFAVHEEAKREAIPLTLASIAKAEKQIVAGINYRLLLTVERSGSPRKAKVIVFRDLNAHYSLTSWEWL